MAVFIVSFFLIVILFCACVLPYIAVHFTSGEMDSYINKINI